jgi:hypothetical protein
MEKIGLKGIIAHYETLLETGKIRKDGPAHQRLIELKLKLKKRKYGR